MLNVIAERAEGTFDRIMVDGNTYEKPVRVERRWRKITGAGSGGWLTVIRIFVYGSLWLSLCTTEDGWKQDTVTVCSTVIPGPQDIRTLLVE